MTLTARLILAAIVVSLSACASVPMAPEHLDVQAKTFSPPPPDRAHVYVYRNELMSGSSEFHLRLNGQPAGSTQAKTFALLSVGPGPNKLESEASNTSELLFHAQPGQTLFVWQEVKLGLGFFPRNKLQLVDPSVGAAGVSECKLIASSPSAPVPMSDIPRTPDYRRGNLFMPYLGVAIPTGGLGSSFDAGLKLGSFLGVHLSPMLSLNAQFGLDFFPESKGADTDYTDAGFVDVHLSPLLHFGIRGIEAFIGPAFGFSVVFAGQRSGGTETSASNRGIGYGVNAGAGIPLGNMVLGALVSFTGRSPITTCVTTSTGYPGPEAKTESCGSYSGDAFHSLSLSGMLLF